MTVPVPGRSYDAVIGGGVLVDADAHLPDLGPATRAFVVTDQAVQEAWLPPLEAAFARRGIRTISLPVPRGEAAKTLSGYATLLHQLATQEAHRDDLVVGLGGGAVGDLAGFLASTYMRGLPLVLAPTTLTAQVDAAIGGKTAVNLPEGKNLVGTFHQPLAVLAEIEALGTLSDRDFRSGLAEVAKYGLAIEPDVLAGLEGDLAPVLARRPPALEPLVAACVAAKARTVAADERDRGVRMHLNYGHTLGHALERLDSFAGRTHGEAVALGMVFAARLSESRGLAEAGLAARTVRLLKALGLEASGPLPPAREVLPAMRLDKKYAGGVRFVLLEGIGRPTVVEGVSDGEISDVLEEMGAQA